MSVYSKTILTPPNTTNESTVNSGNRYPKNNAISTTKNGMPGKSGVSDNGTSFGIGRQYYFNYRNPVTLKDLEELYKNKPNGPNIRASRTSNSSIKTSTVEVGKPIPQNSSDLYLQKKRLLAIGSGSTTKNEGDKLSFNGQDQNIPREARRRAMSGGCVAPNMGRIGPSQPSIFAIRTRR